MVVRFTIAVVSESYQYHLNGRLHVFEEGIRLPQHAPDQIQRFTYLGPTVEVSDVPCRIEGADTFSLWSLRPEERQLIAEGGHIRLGIHGARPIPPVSLQVVANAGACERVPSPCDICGREIEDAVHDAGPDTHAFRCRKVVPFNIMFFPNGRAAVFDQHGNQIGKYQGAGDHDAVIAALQADGFDWRRLKVDGHPLKPHEFHDRLGRPIS